MSHQHVLTEEQLFCLDGCRTYEQYAHMRKQFELEYCPFCTIDLEINVILFEDFYVHCWAVPKIFMRKELAFHFIVAPKRHARFEWELSKAECLSVHEAYVYLSLNYALTGGIIVTRFGDMRLNAGTVPHIHFNIMVPNGTGEVRIPVFKNPKDREGNMTRSAEYARRYESGEIPTF